jgi:hypothetical protein
VPAPAPGPVESVVETGRGAVEQVREPLPALPPVLEQPVQQTLDSVEDVGRTVDDVTGSLLPQLLP